MKDFKEILKLSAEKLDQKDAVITELKHIVKSMTESKHTHESILQHQQADIEHQQKSAQNVRLDLEHKIEQLEYHNKDLAHKLQMTQEFLDEKTAEYEDKVKELNENRKVIAELETEFINMRTEFDELHSTYFFRVL